MATERSQDRPNVVTRQRVRRSLAIDRAHDELLLNQREVLVMWGITNRTLLTALVEGRLRRVRRVGYQPYYLRADVVAAFGPQVRPMVVAVKRGKSPTGGQLSFAEIDQAA